MYVCIKSMCLQGDSGGPATYKHGDQHVLAGVIVGGDSCSSGDSGYCERVAFHRTHFIDKILNDATVCKHGVEADNWL